MQENQNTTPTCLWFQQHYYSLLPFIYLNLTSQSSLVEASATLLIVMLQTTNNFRIIYYILCSEYSVKMAAIFHFSAHRLLLSPLQIIMTHSFTLHLPCILFKWIFLLGRLLALFAILTQKVSGSLKLHTGVDSHCE